MSGAASGSRGWLVADNPEVNFGTGDFTLHWEGSLPEWANGESKRLLGKYENINNRWQIDVGATGKLGYIHRKTSGISVTVTTESAITVSDGDCVKITCAIQRETVDLVGSATFYVNGVIFESVAIPAGTPADIDNTGNFEVCGSSILAPNRIESETIAAIIYNRALSSDAALDLAINDPAPADIGAPGNRASNIASTSWPWQNAAGTMETLATSGTDIISAANSSGIGIVCNSSADSILGEPFKVGHRYRVEFDLTVNSGTVRVRIAPTFDLSSGGMEQLASVTSAQNGRFEIEFVPRVKGSYFGFYNDSAFNFSALNFKVQKIGVTALWSAEHAQSDTGQVLDQIHGNHALMPPTGATIHPQPEGLRQVRSTLTWNGDSSAKYLVSNQDILPEGAEIERVTAVIDGTPVDGNLGDPADPNRYCTLEKNTGLIEGSNRLALSERTTDGTNRELLWTPSAAFTGTIKFTIHYFVGEQ